MKLFRFKFFGGILIIISLSYFLFINNQNDSILSKDVKHGKANACIIVLLRNRDLNRFIKTIKNFEKNFNQKFNYPYVLFNDHDFSENFKNEILKYTNSVIEFAKIPNENWKVPDWIDNSKLNLSIKKIHFTINYRHMCRFYSGFFFRQISTLKFDYYMRIDLDSEFICPVENDPFKKFESNKNLEYGFALTNYEAPFTIPTLWTTIRQWVKMNNITEQKPKTESILSFISNNNGNDLTSMCMFYNNFEIARFSLFRNPIYLNFFEHLDKAGGFYYERWGDSPIHTYYVALMLKKSQVHMFSEFGYEHQGMANFDIKDSKCISKTSGMIF